MSLLVLAMRRNNVSSVQRTKEKRHILIVEKKQKTNKQKKQNKTKLKLKQNKLKRQKPKTKNGVTENRKKETEMDTWILMWSRGVHRTCQLFKGKKTQVISDAIL